MDQEVKGSNPFGSTNSDAPQRLFSFTMCSISSIYARTGSSINPASSTQ